MMGMGRRRFLGTLPVRPADVRSPRLGRPWLAVLLALVGSGCVGGPTTDDLLAVGFRTPRQAFRTFQTAVRADLLDLEYRCWSASFRRRNGLSQHVYREGRRQLLESQPFLRWIAKAEVDGEEALGPDRHRLFCKVEALWVERHFAVDFVRTGFLELRGGRDESELLYDEYLPFERTVRIDPHPDGGWDLTCTAELWPENAYGDPVQADELRVAREWQIHDLRPLDADAGDSEALPPAP